MKHIKLFESFDRYDFKVYDLDNTEQDILNEMYIEMRTKSFVSFGEDEIIEICSIVSQILVWYTGIGNNAYISFPGGEITAFAHGDYTYSIVKTYGFDVRKIEVIDGIDCLCDKLVEIQKKL